MAWSLSFSGVLKGEAAATLTWRLLAWNRPTSGLSSDEEEVRWDGSEEVLAFGSWRVTGLLGLEPASPAVEGWSG